MEIDWVITGPSCLWISTWEGFICSSIDRPTGDDEKLFRIDDASESPKTFLVLPSYKELPKIFSVNTESYQPSSGIQYFKHRRICFYGNCSPSGVFMGNHCLYTCSHFIFTRKIIMTSVHRNRSMIILYHHSWTGEDSAISIKCRNLIVEEQNYGTCIWMIEKCRSPCTHESSPESLSILIYD